MALGRPTKFTTEIVDEILERLGEGETLLAICRDDHMPARSNVSRWVRENPDFQDKVSRAREEGTHALIDEAREIVDDARNDWMEKLGRDGQPAGYVLNGEHIQRSRLRADQRWREAEALAPKVYGKRSTLTQEGGVGIATSDDPDGLMREIMELLSSGGVKLPAGYQVIEIEDAEDDYSDIA